MMCFVEPRLLCVAQLKGGVKAVTVGTARKADNNKGGGGGDAGTTRCFYLTHTNGDKTDFSYVKCLRRLFPNAPRPDKTHLHNSGGNTGGHANRGGRGFRGRGRGGRGGRFTNSRGRGGFRGRGFRGRGRRGRGRS